MASALEIAIARLSATVEVTNLCPAARIYPILAPQGAPFPHLVVELIHEGDQAMLAGAAEYYISRVSIRCIAQMIAGQSSAAALVNSIGEAVKLALKDNANGDIVAGVIPDFYKADGDVTMSSDDRTAAMRILDVYVRWRNP